ncbi:MAG: hypothetical protein ACI4PF_06650, partial [Christensenellales bacterium]
MKDFNKCDSCGGELKFNPKSSNVECYKCHKIYAIAKEEFKYHDIDMLGVVKEIDVKSADVNLKCINCGASFKGDRLKMSNVCEYCGSHLVEDFSKMPTIKPDGIIPYAFDKEEAKIKFAENLRKNFLVPNKLKKSVPYSTIESIYIPAFHFKCSSQSSYYGKLEKRQEEDGQTEYKVFEIRGTKTLVDDNLLVECSDYLTQNTLEEIKPYDIKSLCKFNTGFIMGYSVEHLNKKLSIVREQIKSMHSENIRKSILREYDYDSVKSLSIDTTYNNSSYAYIILPTYKINYTYKNKVYNTFMNGQTGKLNKDV